ncbi:MAG: Rpn family recombination-promoting nuclease/putative transposase, partial [Clostridia bacterium]|nr:Rpn family recombination-promoting nuclease/putative transposase [Clostridia bacterium]
MGDKDIVTKEYMQDSAIFADAFNFLLYGGEQRIKPEQLRPVDTTAIVLPYGENGEASVPIQKYRDILKTVTVMRDGKAAYLLLGIENQSQIHYAMPVRNMLYDAMQYVSQVEEAGKSHRKGKSKPETGAEFLSGFYRTDKLLPVITLTLYFGAEPWTAPTDLYEMLSADAEILRFVDNYHLHLIAPAQIPDTEFDKFHTELRIALQFMKHSLNKNQLQKLVKEDEAYRHVSRKTADMLNIVTGADLPYEEGKESINM